MPELKQFPVQLPVDELIGTLVQLPGGELGEATVPLDLVRLPLSVERSISIGELKVAANLEAGLPVSAFKRASAESGEEFVVGGR
jgi:hypothetical protein